MENTLQELEKAIADATKDMSVLQLKQHPEGKWCVAEVLEHLYLTHRGTTKGLERCLAQGKPQARRRNLQDRIRTAVVVGLGYMPTGRKAPELSAPRGMAAEDIVNAIGPQLKAMEDALSNCEAKFGSRARILDHPVLGPLTARQWRKFHWVHGKHHVKQIWRLRGRV